MLTEEQIHDIAEHLDMGFNCYYHIHTKNIVKIPNNDLGDLDEEAYATEIEELEENFMEYRPVAKMSSVESFHMMEGFIETLDETNEVKEKLQEAITLKKPFRQFKDVLDNFLDTKELWRTFRQNVIMDWVRTQLPKTGGGRRN